MRSFFGGCIFGLITFSNVINPALAAEKLIITTIEGHPLVEYATGIMQKVYKKIGYDIEVWPLPAARALYMSSQGKADAELGRYGGLSKAYPELIQVSPALVNFSVVMLTTDTNIKTLPDTNALPNPIAIQRGSVYSKVLIGERTKIEVNSIQQIMKLLQTGRSKIALVDDSYLELINQLNTANNIYIVPLAADAYPVYHYVHQRHRNLIPQIQQALLEMQQQGLLADQKRPLARPSFKK
ncbi:substrate-binding periplasmic protein [Catenovulum sp. SX2]|uniref:substrate-binding periplasmic protein n=1 Tax=Catenovulum sp. SX2 TaxID=3398614 RepID=UPI003F82DC11